MKPAFLIPFFVSLSLLAGFGFAGSELSAPKSDVASALADLRAERERSPVTTMERVTAANDAFFSRIDVEALSLDELAMTLELYPFNYGEKAKALALATAHRLTPFVAAPDTDGALAAAIRYQLSDPAGIPGDVRKVWASEYLAHPSLIPLVQGKRGDLALATACRAVRTDAEKEQLIALAGQLDAFRSVAATGAIVDCWNRITKILPPGERREAVRVQLAEYLKAVRALDTRDRLSASTRDRLEQNIALLEGPQARGELISHPAPEIEFIWSSRDGWKRLSDVRNNSGKVVVLDFWATWCGPCVASFPHMRDLVEHYRGHAVEIVGVTSLQGTIVGLRSGAVNCKGDPEKEMRLMSDFMKEKEMTWPVVISREPVFNPDYGVQGIPTLTIIAPDGTVRHSTPGLAVEDTRKRINALLEEFHLSTPAPASETKS